MPSQLEWTTTGNVATTALPTAFLTLTIGVQTATQPLRLWNNLDGSAPPASTATEIHVYPAYQVTAGGPWLLSGCRPADEKWLWGRFNGTIQNPGGTSGGDYVAFTTEWMPIGSGSVLLSPSIPNYFAREAEFYMYPQGSGGTVSINDMQIVVQSDRGIISLGPYASIRQADQCVVMRGDASRYEILRGWELQGFRLKLHPTLTDRIVVEQGLLKKGNAGIAPMPRQLSSAIDDTAADGATAPGEEYTIRFDANPTGTGFTETKGNKAVVGASLLPAAPAGNYTPLGYTTKPNGGALTTPVQQDRHDLATLTASGVGLGVNIGPRVGCVADLLQVDDSQATLTVTNAVTRNILLSAQGVVTESASAPTAGQTLVGRFTSAGGNVTALDNRKLITAPAEYLSRRRIAYDSCNAEVDFTTGNDIYLFGRLIAGGAGAVPQTVTAVSGDRAAARVTAFTTYGSLVMTGTAINGAGTESAAATETFIINKVDDWVWSLGRWLGTGGNSNDVVMSASGGLVASVATYRGRLWDNGGKPFAVAALEVQFWPRSAVSALRVYCFKVNKTGAVSTLYDSTAKVVGLPSVPCSLRLDMLAGTTTRTDRNADGTYVMLWDTPIEAFVEGHMGEGIYVHIDGLVDIGVIQAQLEYYDLMVG